ncbi:hypothetical protein KW807_02400 [Candidatus Parcubacteria bacterium]|nr:hypothetical protein [Candidatus Parcubacteria bacterium]
MRNFGMKKIMLWSAVALIIPLLGNRFVDGWNWTWHDFLFAWVFFVVMASSVKCTMMKIAHTSYAKYRVAIGVIVFLIFAAIWVMLATG